MPTPSTPSLAFAIPEVHSFAAGRGFFLHDEALPRGPVLDTSLCDPPREAEDGSSHRLRPPHRGAADITFAWRPSRRVWVPEVTDLGRARRLGFRAEFLSSHGWRYAGPA